MKSFEARCPVVVCKFLNVSGMALFPFVLIKRSSLKEDKRLLNHEHIHLRQQIELLWFPFMILYLGNYLVNRFRYPTHREAYLNIIFEREAFAMDHQADYLKRRKMFAFVKFFRQSRVS